MPESLVKEFNSLLDERLDVQDVVCEAQNLLRLSRPVTAVYSITSQIIWYKIHVVETLTVVITVKFYAMHTLHPCQSPLLRVVRALRKDFTQHMYRRVLAHVALHAMHAWQANSLR